MGKLFVRLGLRPVLAEEEARFLLEARRIGDVRHLGVDARLVLLDGRRGAVELAGEPRHPLRVGPAHPKVEQVRLSTLPVVVVRVVVPSSPAPEAIGNAGFSALSPVWPVRLWGLR